MPKVSVSVVAAVLVAATPAGCNVQPGSQYPTPSRGWTITLAYARDQASSGAYEEADSALHDFARRHPETFDGAEASFWSAMFEIDPGNAHHSPASALLALDAYAASSGPRRYDLEAEVLRRIAVHMTLLTEETAQAASEADSARTEADSVRTRADSARLVRTRERTEILRLRDSLYKVLGSLAETNQELERIKKRLVTPRP